MQYKIFGSYIYPILIGMMILMLTACNYLDDIEPQVVNKSQQKSNIECQKDTQYLKLLSPQDLQLNDNSDYYKLPYQFGVGWGYNKLTGLFNKKGIKDKIIDENAVAAYAHKTEQEPFIDIDNMSGSNINRLYGSNYQSLSTEIAVMVYGGVDLKVVSAEISVEFSQLKTQTKSAQYFYVSDMRNVKRVSLSNELMISLTKADVLPSLLTPKFKSAIEQDSPYEIIRKFGTDLIISSNLGGRLEYYFTADCTALTNVEHVITTIQAKVLWWEVSTSVDVESTWHSVQNSFDGRFSVIGGGVYGTQLNQLFNDAFNYHRFPNVKPSAYVNWNNCFLSASKVNPLNLGMLDFQTIPISDLIEPINSAKAKEIDKILKNTQK